MILSVQIRMGLSQSRQAADAAWIEQIKDLLVVDLQERTEDAEVTSLVVLPNGFNLLEKFFDSALSNTMIDLPRIIVWYLALVTLHGERFATAGLAVGEDRAVIAVDDTINEASHAEALINAILIIFRRKHLIEAVNLATVETTAERVVHF